MLQNYSEFQRNLAVDGLCWVSSIQSYRGCFLEFQYLVLFSLVSSIGLLVNFLKHYDIQ